ncbi:phosphoribosyltransferase family protein [Legionella genomosp. 1]|uniref:phosphoribosyltransferase family protein n=1 Tax=Legionella genomosp. 1 TaxID=1093625 RepID=UPI00105468F0|nr:phosphoribosyltransferase family protein [Legionella genomosp. 1]
MAIHAPRHNTRTSLKDGGEPAALIHLDIDQETLKERLTAREDSRCDDNQDAIQRRLNFYQQTTLPLIRQIKENLCKKAISIRSAEAIRPTSLFIYANLQRIDEVHTVLQKGNEVPAQQPLIDSEIRPVGLRSVLSQLWKTGIEYKSIKSLQENYKTQNLSFSLFNKKMVYLETAAEVRQVLESKSHLGHVYRHFSQAAGLKYEFVATDSGDDRHFVDQQQQVNVWKLIHSAFGQTIKSDRQRIERLIDVHLDRHFFATKTFELDTAFDTFFSSFWSEYLFGNNVSLEAYQQTRHQILSAMKQCFYSNYYKSLDPSGLTSWLYELPVNKELQAAKKAIQEYIGKATSQSMVKRFEADLNYFNEKEQLGLDAKTIAAIVSDCVFDLIFEPDFLENVMYEALAIAVKEHADLRDPMVRARIYEQGLDKGYLFPIRTRILDEDIQLADGTSLSAGTMTCLNLKQAGIYHSAGARRCVGQAYTHYFKEHFFNRIEAVDFKVKEVTEPADRQIGNENVPVSPERYLVSWKLRRDEAMRNMSYHAYKGNRFFDVLKLHENSGLNTHMVRQMTLKIQRYIEKNSLAWKDVVIATAEVRGIPVASQVAGRLQLPLYTIRKKGGYKMPDEAVQRENIQKGYGDPDVLELPTDKIKSLAGKTVIFLDDGIASGESAEACIKLLQKPVSEGKKPAVVKMVMTLLQHDYVQTSKLSQLPLVKTLFDCRSKAAVVSETNQASEQTGLIIR